MARVREAGARLCCRLQVYVGRATPCLLAAALLLASGCKQGQLAREVQPGSESPRDPNPEAGPGSALSSDMGGFWLPALESGSDNSVPAPPAGSYLDGLTVDPLYRESSKWLFDQYYTASEGVDVGWTGDLATCDAGTTSAALRDAVLRRVNYFRVMAGVPAIVSLIDEYSDLAQRAALMMSVNGRLGHWPDEAWGCYSVEGYEGASHSLLFLSGSAGEAVDAYVEDRGGGNGFVPHRRMLLYPHTKSMGTGDVPPGDHHMAANALWVLGAMSVQRPETRDGFVAWPPPGYVPHQVVFPRWSLSHPEADFAAATVSMASQGREFPLRLLPVVDGFGENTIVWEPSIEASARPTVDRWLSVEVRDVLVGKRTYNFSYTVIVYDPAS